MKALVLAMAGLLVVGLGAGVNAQTSTARKIEFCGEQWPADAKSIKCSRVSDLKGIGAFKALEELYLWRTKVTDAGLKHLAGLKALQTLDLSDTKVTDAGLKHLAGLKALKELGLEDTKVTDAGVSRLKRALPNCDIRK